MSPLSSSNLDTAVDYDTVNSVIDNNNDPIKADTPSSSGSTSSKRTRRVRFNNNNSSDNTSVDDVLKEFGLVGLEIDDDDADHDYRDDDVTVQIFPTISRHDMSYSEIDNTWLTEMDWSQIRNDFSRALMDQQDDTVQCYLPQNRVRSRQRQFEARWVVLQQQKQQRLRYERSFFCVSSSPHRPGQSSSSNDPDDMDDIDEAQVTIANLYYAATYNSRTEAYLAGQQLAIEVSRDNQMKENAMIQDAPTIMIMNRGSLLLDQQPSPTAMAVC